MMRALVTGASRGIGGATCMKLARDSLGRGEQAKIVACATGIRADLHELVAELKGLGAEAIALTGDLADPEGGVATMTPRGRATSSIWQ